MWYYFESVNTILTEYMLPQCLLAHLKIILSLYISFEIITVRDILFPDSILDDYSSSLLNL